MNAIPSAATIIFGAMAGQLIQNRLPAKRTMRILLAAGLGGILLGLALSPWFPLVKRIWTPSFTVYAGGWTTLMLLAFYWTLEVMGWRKWAFPLAVVGMNSIAAYVLGNAFGGWIAGLRQPMGPWFAVFEHALFGLAAWLVLYWLYRRKVFFKA